MSGWNQAENESTFAELEEQGGGWMGKEKRGEKKKRRTEAWMMER